MYIKRCLKAVFLIGFISLCVFFAFSEESRVKTKEEAVEYLLNEVIKGNTEIRMKADEALYDVLSDAESLYDIMGLSKIATAEWWFDGGILCLDNITSYPESVYCECMEDALKAFNSKKDFVVLNLSDAFYDEFVDSDFALYYMLDRLAGIESRNCVYYQETRVFIYEDVVYAGNIAYIENVDELKRHISACARNLDAEISYVLSEKMFEMVRMNASIEQEMYAVNGMFSYQFLMTDEYRMRQVTDIVYYPGARIIRAVRSNALDMLTDEEYRLYETALSIAQKAVDETEGRDNREILIEKSLVRQIAERCAYESRAESRYNTALGALLYGIADCDGYADAFYLTGNLAGLEVYHQLGNMLYGGHHMWNLVYADGSWHFTDPTGGDLNMAERPDAVRPEWIGMGRETALSHYIWQPVSQIAQVDEDADDMLAILLEGKVFDSLTEARNYLDRNTAVWTQFVINGIGEEEAGKIAEEAVYGYGGPYTHYWTDDQLYVFLLSSWFDYENFYDCGTEADVIKALKMEQDEIIVRLTEEMFETFLEDAGNALDRMQNEAGITSCQRNFYDSARVFIYNDIERN